MTSKPGSPANPILFANTGVQIIARKLPERPSARPVGWQPCFCQYSQPSPPTALKYVQWQIVDDQLFVALDTTLGPTKHGHVREDGHLEGPYTIKLRRLCDDKGTPIEGLASFSLDVQVHPKPLNSEAEKVHLVIDFGNSRTMALLIELSGSPHPQFTMLPFVLQDRFQFRRGQNCFLSQTVWCTPPYRRPEAVEVIRREYRDSGRPAGLGLFGARQEQYREVIETEHPRLFDDLSMARLGREAEDLTRLVAGNALMGVSSPKRYLWADDAQWLSGRNWSMAVPHDVRDERKYADELRGPLLEYFDAQDSDILAGDDFRKHVPDGRIGGSMPDGALPPRCLMTAALYEILCQAQQFANSEEYRRRTGDGGRPRVVASMTLSYPSGMVFDERRRFLLQARKAAAIFHCTAGRRQAQPPEVSLSVDEASAAQLTYVWGELQKMGHDPRLWFEILSRVRLPPAAAAPAAPSEEALPAEIIEESGFRWDEPEGASPLPDFAGNVLAEPAGQSAQAPKPVPAPELRVACIDIGGGTTDLMIARYAYRTEGGVSIEGEILHRDGVTIAGDRLVERLLEQLIVPRFAAAVGMSPKDVTHLFGEENDSNREFRMNRINWMNRLFVPLAQRYLECAVVEDMQSVISHHVSELSQQRIVDPDVVRDLRNVAERLGKAAYNFEAEMELRYDPRQFETIATGVFGALLHDFCSRILRFGADVVLLAGQPTKLRFLQQFVRMRLPLHDSRVIPMHGHYAGAWYPYQDAGQPGVIVDPKSAVVVGAGLNFLARRGNLPQFSFTMKSAPGGRLNRFFWGVMHPAQPGIPDHNLWFRADQNVSTIRKRIEFPDTLIGRKLRAHERDEATPVYHLQILGPGDKRPAVDVEIERSANPDDPTEERLQLTSVGGFVDGDKTPAVLGKNVLLKLRTLGDRKFFLDVGGLHEIDTSRLR